MDDKDVERTKQIVKDMVHEIFDVEAWDVIFELVNEQEAGIAAFKQRLAKTKTALPLSDADHPEVYGKFNWENRTGKRGMFQMIRKDNCSDTQLFNHLEAMLKQNRNNLTISDHHYWLGQEGFIFRRKKKS